MNRYEIAWRRVWGSAMAALDSAAERFRFAATAVIRPRETSWAAGNLKLPSHAMHYSKK